MPFSVHMAEKCGQTESDRDLERIDYAVFKTGTWDWFAQATENTRALFSMKLPI